MIKFVQCMTPDDKQGRPSSQNTVFLHPRWLFVRSGMGLEALRALARARGAILSPTCVRDAILWLAGLLSFTAAARQGLAAAVVSVIAVALGFVAGDAAASLGAGSSAAPAHARDSKPRGTEQVGLVSAEFTPAQGHSADGRPASCSCASSSCVDSPVGREVTVTPSKTSVQSLRQHLESSETWAGLSSAQKRFCSDTILQDYADLGRSVGRTTQYLLSTLRWRESQGFHAELLPACAECVASMSHHCAFGLGRDKRGREVLYSCPGRSRLKDPDSCLRHMWLVAEAALRRSPEAKLLFLVDLQGFGLRDMDPRSGTRFVPVMLSHHPGRFAQFALLSPPLVFKVIYNMLAPLCPASTIEKVKMLRGRAQRDFCARYLTTEQLEFVEEALRLPPRPGHLPAATATLVPANDPSVGLRKVGGG